MAIIGNNTDAFLNGLSDFWIKLFRDIGDIQATYEGTAYLLGQTYLDLMHDVLNLSVQEAPLFEKEYYRLISVREDQVRYIEGAGGRPSVFEYVADAAFDRIPQLQNKVFSPTAALEDGLDYTVNRDRILFFQDPTFVSTDTQGRTTPLAGYAARSIDVLCGGFFKSQEDVPDWHAAGVKKGDQVVVNSADATVPYATSSKFTIVHVAKNKLALATKTPVTTYPQGLDPVGFAWKIVREKADGSLINVTSSGSLSTDGYYDGRFLPNRNLTVTEVALWAVDARVDTHALYRNFGHFFGPPRASSENYRAFIRGLMQLYIMGPAIDRLESALNVTAHLAVVRDDGERLLEYADGLDGYGNDGSLSSEYFTSPTAAFVATNTGAVLRITGCINAANVGSHKILEVVSANTVRLLNERRAAFIDEPGNINWELSQDDVKRVTTDKNQYTYPRNIPIRDDVAEPANWGVLTFRAFEPLTNAIRVTDYIKDPTWWHHIVIPANVLPGQPVTHRTVTTELYPNYIGSRGRARVGDPGFYVGASENGDVADLGYRHLPSFILMDRFLKLHIFGVTVSPGVFLNEFVVNDLENILRQVKPAHTDVYFQPVTAFQDTVTLADAVDARAVLRVPASGVDVFNNHLSVGGAWTLGMSWKYSTSEGGAYVTSGDGCIELVIGGEDPSAEPPDRTGTPDMFGTLTDRPLYFTIRSA